MGIKPGPKRIAKSTGKPDRRQRDNKQTPGNTSSLKPHIHKKGIEKEHRCTFIVLQRCFLQIIKNLLG